MTLQDCYKAMGADYDEVFGRLRSERLIQKFVLRFPDDGSLPGRPYHQGRVPEPGLHGPGPVQQRAYGGPALRHPRSQYQ